MRDNLIRSGEGAKCSRASPEEPNCRAWIEVPAARSARDRFLHMAQAEFRTGPELMELWTRVRVEVVVAGAVLVLFDPLVGYPDLAAAFVLAGASRAERLYVITAWNPAAKEREARFNRLDQARMLLRLSRRGVGFFPSRGSAEGWAEPGTAFFSASDELAASLAERFVQLGYYSFSPSQGVCVDATGGFAEAPLRPIGPLRPAQAPPGGGEF